MFKITSVASPHAVQDSPTPAHVIAARTARAVEAFNKGAPLKAVSQSQAQETAVLDPSNVSVEELSAITSPSQEMDKNTEVEAPVTEVTPEPAPEKDPALSRQFAQLARQERAYRLKVQQQEQAIKAREAAIQAKEEAMAAKDREYQSDYIRRDRIKQDALGVLDESGVSYDELTQQALTRQPTDPRVMNTINKLEAKIAELESKATEQQKSYTEQQQQAYNSAVKQIESDVKALVRNDPNFETVRATGSVRDVVELITKTHAKTGIVLSVEEAAEQVEEYLVEEAMKLTRLEKIKRRVQQSAQTAKPTQQTQAKQQSQMKTLTNATSSTRKLSARERALLAFKGELKS